MKFLFLLILMITISQGLWAQYFQVKKIKSDEKYFYKIKEIDDKSDFGTYNYPISLVKKIYTTTDTVAMIAELLKFEGDDRIAWYH